MDNVNIYGRIANDLELRTTNSGISVISFSVAVRKWAGGGEKTNFFDCVAYKTNAENIAKGFRKGSRIAISGSLDTREWEDKNGCKRKNVEIIVDRFDFVDSKSESDNVIATHANGYGAGQAHSDPAIEIELSEEDLPF